MEFITDRKESDVLERNKKGVYSVSDLNRVESLVEELAQYLPQLDIMRTFETKTNWGLPEDFSKNEWVTESEMTRYLDNIKALKEAFSISTKLPASMNKLTWVYANNIEKVLQQSFVRAQNIIGTFKYSGEIYAGEE